MVIDDNYDYESVAKSAIYDWVILNPDLKFEKVDNNYRNIDFKIVYRDYDSEGNVGHYFVEEKSWYSYFNDAGQRITVTPRVENAEGSITAEQMMENSISHNILLIDTKIRDCRGKSQQCTLETMKDVTKWAIGSHFGLGNHIDVTHLMYNDDPNTKIPYDDLGYNIPDTVDVYYTVE